eukprot:3941980-Rhodomonas_salina.5
MCGTETECGYAYKRRIRCVVLRCGVDTRIGDDIFFKCLDDGWKVPNACGTEIEYGATPCAGLGSRVQGLGSRV